MLNYDLLRARKAVQLLVDLPYFSNRVRKLRSYVKKPRALPFTDETEPLNELLVIGRQNEQAMENLIIVAEHKRDDRGEYQRRFMAAKRKRDRKVIQLEELMTGVVLGADERRDLLQRQYEMWNKEREQFLSKFVGLSWTERNDKIHEFWDRKEAELDALAAEAKARGPVRRKRVVKVERQPKSDFGKTLKQALTYTKP